MLMGGFSHFVGHISRFFHVLQGTLQVFYVIQVQSIIILKIFRKFMEKQEKIKDKVYKN